LLADIAQSLQNGSEFDDFMGSPTFPKGRAWRISGIDYVWKPPNGVICCQLASEKGLRSEVGVGTEYSEADSDAIEPLRSSIPL
jgi:hypothetical protein